MLFRSDGYCWERGWIVFCQHQMSLLVCSGVKKNKSWIGRLHFLILLQMHKFISLKIMKYYKCILRLSWMNQGRKKLQFCLVGNPRKRCAPCYLWLIFKGPIHELYYNQNEQKFVHRSELDEEIVSYSCSSCLSEVSSKEALNYRGRFLRTLFKDNVFRCNIQCVECPLCSTILRMVKKNNVYCFMCGFCKWDSIHVVNADHPSHLFGGFSWYSLYCKVNCLIKKKNQKAAKQWKSLLLRSRKWF